MRQQLRSIACAIVLFSLSFISLNAQEAAKKGTLAGKITDSKTGEEIIGATVAIDGTSTGASTDLDGKYFLKLNPGTYTVLVSYVSYKTKKLEGIEIKAGELNSINIALAEDSKELEEVVVVGEAKKESAAGLLLQQKNSVAVSSGISADLIRKMPDRTTADVIKRVSGASIQDGKFAIIRGLSDRYNYGMINGTPLPSSEADRKAFSLDIVPAQVVDNIIISKTATPDMPGDFAGGLIQINTKDIPEENTRTLVIGLRGHSLTTFKNFYNSPQASSTDWLGYDNGPRQLPAPVANIPIATSVALDPTTEGAKVVQQTNAFNNNFVPKQTTALPNLALQLGASQRAKLFGNDFGVIAALTYNTIQQNTPTSSTINPIIGSNSFDDTRDFSFKYKEYINSKSNVNIGGILNFSYKVGQNTKLTFKNLLTENSENSSFSRIGDNFAGTFGNTNHLYVDQYSNSYSSNRMLSSQLGAETYFPKSKIKARLTGGYNNLYRSLPDYKYLTFVSPPGVTDTTKKSVALLSDPKGGTSTVYSSGRFFSTLTEQSGSISGDVTIPFYLLGKNELKLGGMYQARSRDFNSRTFVFGYNPTTYYAGPYYNNIINSTPSNIFNTQNIASPDGIFQKETTQDYNKYTASSLLYAGFLMMDTKFSTKFRAIYGLRVESFNQKLNARNAGVPVIVDKTWIDPLPSVNLIYAITEQMNLRASYSRTVSRPEFREFAPLAFYNLNINAIQVGNQYLQRATINNFDMKYEIYPSPGSTFSVNPFVKLFNGPIEQTVDPGGDGLLNFSYQNAKSATNYGVEFEVRVTPKLFSKSVSDQWDKFTLFSNFAYINSSVDLSNFQATGSDVKSRPMQGQSPYVFNGGLQFSDPKSGWDLTFAANQVGRRIAYVNNTKNQIIWENPRLILDFSVTKSFANDRYKIRGIVGDLLAQNLIFYNDVNDDGRFDSGDVTTYKYRNGQTVTLQALFNF